MQQISPGYPTIPVAVMAIPKASDFTPQAMAQYLRRTSGAAAFCFAQAMHEGSAWANKSWGEYWASVMRLV